MTFVAFITHPDVTIDPALPIPDWELSPRGLERMALFCNHAFVARITQVFSSGERKARDGADMLAQRLGLTPQIDLDLGENDRSATGYLPKAEFVEMARQFFAQPEKSVRGWERAVDAQHRIANALRRIVDCHPGDNIAIVSHGGVGTLLMCHLLNQPISLSFAPKIPEGGGYFILDADRFELVHGWLDIGQVDPSCAD